MSSLFRNIQLMTQRHFSDQIVSKDVDIFLYIFLERNTTIKQVKPIKVRVSLMQNQFLPNASQICFRAFAALFLVSSCPSSFISGILRDYTGTYDWSMVVCGLLLVSGGIFFITAGCPKEYKEKG